MNLHKGFQLLVRLRSKLEVVQLQHAEVSPDYIYHVTFAKLPSSPRYSGSVFQHIEFDDTAPKR